MSRHSMEAVSARVGNYQRQKIRKKTGLWLRAYLSPDSYVGKHRRADERA